MNDDQNLQTPMGEDAAAPVVEKEEEVVTPAEGETPAVEEAPQA